MRTSRIFSVLLAGFAVSVSAAQAPADSAAQVAAGAASYEALCSTCHGGELTGAGYAPAVAGELFQRGWAGRPVGELHDYIVRTMPVNAPGSLTEDEGNAIVAYILAYNGADLADEAYVGSEEQAAAELEFNVVEYQTAAAVEVNEGEDEAPEFDLAAAGSTTTWRAVETWEPVTADQLLNPNSADWLNYRRTLDSHNDSPLDQITVDNVGQLRHEWAWASDDDYSFQATPVVTNGVMFVNEHGDGFGRVVALDALNGDVLWTYERSYPGEVGSRYTHGVTVYGDLVLWGSADSTVIALDARTGEEVWLEVAGDYRDYTVGSFGAPGVVIDDKFIIGNTRGDQGARGRIDAFDVATGELVWRAYTTPAPGESGSETWGAATPLGATPWMPGTYDAGLGLIYFGTGQPSPWTPLLRGSGDFDAYEDAAAHANSIIALDVDTGEIVWNFAVLPGEFWDYDTAYEVVLFEAEVDGGMRELLFQSNKAGWAVVLDRATGEFINAFQVSLATVVDHYTEDGRVVYVADQIPDADDVTNNTSFFTCPFISGARGGGPNAYSPRTGLVYGAFNDHCMDVRYTMSGVGMSFTFKLAPDQDHVGHVRAIDPLTGEEAWHFIPETGAGIMSGTLSTDGGLVFVGTTDRWLYALDESNGEVLWRTRVNGDVGPMITYELDGRQFVSVVGGANVFATGMINPALGVPVPQTTGTVWTFALPEQN